MWFKLPNCRSFDRSGCYDHTDFKWSVIEHHIAIEPSSVLCVEGLRELNGIFWGFTFGRTVEAIYRSATAPTQSVTFASIVAQVRRLGPHHGRCFRGLR